MILSESLHPPCSSNLNVMNLSQCSRNGLQWRVPYSCAGNDPSLDAEVRCLHQLSRFRAYLAIVQALHQRHQTQMIQCLTAHRKFIRSISSVFSLKQAQKRSAKSSSSTSISSRVTLILSIVFGLVILAVLLLGLAMYLCNRRYNHRLARTSGSSSRSPFAKGSTHMRERSEVTATNSSKHVTFLYNQGHASSQASGFGSPLHSPGLLLPPETFRSPVSPSFDHGSTFPRDREQLLSPTSTVPSTLAGPGVLAATLPLRRSHEQPQPRPQSPWQGSLSATNRSDSPVSTNALLASDRKAHQHHTPKHSGSTAQSRLQPSLKPLSLAQDHHVQQQQAVSAIMEHLNGSQRDLRSPNTPLFEQSLLQPPNPNPPPIGPLPARPILGSTDRRPSIDIDAPSINSHTKLEPNRLDPTPGMGSPAFNIDPNTFLIPDRPAPRPPNGPRRPERPRDGGLLDWFGGLERKRSGKKDRDDGNSMQTNFLKM